MVARVALNNMHQDHDEPIRSFSARLKGQAGVCKYITPCPGCDREVDYTEQILRDVLSRGVADPDIQLELLSHVNQNMTLEEVLKFVQTKEAGKRSATRLLEHNNTSAIRSQYKRGKKEIKPDNATKQETSSKCLYCGGQSHGTNTSQQARKSTCPAFNHTCGHCHRLHHFDHVCRSKKLKGAYNQPDHAASVEESNTLFNSLCSVVTGPSKPADHHCYDKTTGTWHKVQSQPQPFVSLSVRLVEEDYQELGFTPIHGEKTTPIMVPAMADTGCQSCLIGYKWIQRLQLNRRDLLR